MKKKPKPITKSKINFKKWWQWLDQNLLFILGSFLLAFIPLWPKIPLFSPIEQYIVRVRIEDLVVGLTVLVWLIQVLRKKIKWQTWFVLPIGAYLIFAALSLLSAVFIIHTIPLQALHLGKSILHFFRYIEYFTLFFITFSGITSKKQAQISLGVISLTVLLVSIYGVGQKYYYWPVYSTMNREFSKGVRLYLTEHARVQSTFAGHYDLGGYLTLILPIILAIALNTKNKKVKWAMHLVHWSGLWLLVVSASRTSFGAYLGAVSLVIGVTALYQSKWWNKIKYFLSRYALLVLMVSLTTIYFGDQMQERLLQVVNSNQTTSYYYNEINARRKEFAKGNLNQFFVNLGLENVAQLFPKPSKPQNAISTDDAQQIVLSSDTRPTETKPTDRPADVYEDIPDKVRVATVSATGETVYIEVEKERTFSTLAQKYGLSLGIRLDTLWPLAIDGFLRNPALGSGYATLNKTQVYQFTEADSTDNNFLRTLGETGLLGFSAFYGAIGAGIYLAYKGIRQKKDDLLRWLSLGYLAGSLGLLVNALFIDVYAASKVAFIFWGVTGLLVSYYYLIMGKPNWKMPAWLAKKTSLVNKSKDK